MATFKALMLEETDGKVSSAIQDIDDAQLPDPDTFDDDDVARVAPMVLEYARSTKADALVVSCFSDPGVETVRQHVRGPAGHRAGALSQDRIGEVGILEIGSFQERNIAEKIFY